MSARCFVDTNILLYIPDARDAKKQSVAVSCIKSIRKMGELCINLQVINEFMANAQRLFSEQPVSQIRSFIADFFPACTASYDCSTVRNSWSLQDRYGFSCWDSLIVASALEARCRFLVSEDFQNGQHVDDMVLVNPFETDIDTVLK
jgi:predicted nucleic acid-binding protein